MAFAGAHLSKNNFLSPNPTAPSPGSLSLTYETAAHSWQAAVSCRKDRENLNGSLC